MKFYLFRAVPLPIIRSLFTVHLAMVYVVQVCRQLSSRTRMELVTSWSCSKAVYKPVWHIPLLSVQWINSWWWAEELLETCRVSCWSKFGKLVHLIGFIINKLTENVLKLPTLNTRTDGQRRLLRNPTNGNLVYCMPRRRNRTISTLSFNKTQRSV